MAQLVLHDLEAYEQALRVHPRILLFKHSPICPISTAAHAAYAMWRLDLDDVPTMFVNVVAERAVARGIAERCGVRHESPQAAWAPRC
jgi:bacillithiol system protein YtxJ